MLLEILETFEGNFVILKKYEACISFVVFVIVFCRGMDKPGLQSFENFEESLKIVLNK